MTTRRRLRWTMVATVLAAVLFLGAAASASSPADSVESVSVVVETAPPIPEILRARIEASVARVAERLMLEKPVVSVQNQRVECERIIREIFGRLLSGFRLDELLIVAETKTTVIIRLSHDGPFVDRVEVACSAPGLSEGSAAILNGEIPSYRNRFARVLLGIPVKAFAWVQPILIPVLEDMLLEECPGFEPSVRFEPGETLILQVTMKPLQPVVDRVLVEVTSDSLPRFLAGTWRKQAEAHLEALKGMPVAYLRRRQVELERLVESRLEDDPALNRFKLHWRATLYPGLATQARLSVDAEDCSLRVNGNMTIADPPIVGVALQAGYRPWVNWEVSGGALLDTSGQDPGWDASLSYRMNGEITIGMTYSSRVNENLLWFRYSSDRGDLFLLGGSPDSGRLLATIGVEAADQLLLTLTVDSTRRYELMLHVSL